MLWKKATKSSDKCWDRRNNFSDLAEQSLDDIERLLDGEDIDSDEIEIDLPLVAAMNRLLDCPYTFDGITGLIARKRKSRQIVFEGKIRVVSNSAEWDEKLEPFKAIVTDKRMTKQGLHIKIRFGEEIKEGDILEIL